MNGLGNSLVRAIEARAEKKRRSLKGPVGDYFRAGGNSLLYENLPVVEDDLVLDVGGYMGEWTAGMQSKYGCRSEIFEPVPEFADRCHDQFEKNKRVRLHRVALGGENRAAIFSHKDNGTSEFIDGAENDGLNVKVLSIVDFLGSLGQAQQNRIAVLKMNIEGGEYEVLEALRQAELIERFACLLIQFHRQPDDWSLRYDSIVNELGRSHKRVWGFPMVWERWDIS